MGKNKRYYPWVVMAACFLYMGAVIGVGTNCHGIFLLPVAADLGVGIGEISTCVTIMGITGALSAPVVGNLLDRIDVRAVMTIGAAVSGGAYLALGRIESIRQFWLVGGILGAGVAFGSFLTVTVVLNHWFVKNNGLVIGVTLGSSSLVGVIMNPVLNRIIELHGWRTAYTVMGVIILATLPIVWLFVRTRPEELGTVAWGASAQDMAGAVEIGRTERQDDVSARSVVRSPAFLLVIGFALLVSSMANHLGHFTNIAVSAGLTAELGALMISCGQAGEFTGKLAIGWLSDRYGVRRAIYLVLAVGAAGLLGFLFIGPGAPALALLCAYAYGPMTAIGSVGYSLIVKKLFGVEHYAKCYPYVSIASTVAFSVGFPIIGYLYDAVGSYAPSFCVSICGLALAAVVLTAAMKKGER